VHGGYSESIVVTLMEKMAKTNVLNWWSAQHMFNIHKITTEKETVKT